MAILNVSASSNTRTSSPVFFWIFSRRYTSVFLCTYRRLPSLIYSGYYRRMYKQSSVLLLRKYRPCQLRILHSGTSRRVMPEADGSAVRFRVHCMQGSSSLYKTLFRLPKPYLLLCMIWIHPFNSSTIEIISEIWPLMISSCFLVISSSHYRGSWSSCRKHNDLMFPVF